MLPAVIFLHNEPARYQYEVSLGGLRKTYIISQITQCSSLYTFYTDVHVP